MTLANPPKKQESSPGSIKLFLKLILCKLQNITFHYYVLSNNLQQEKQVLYTNKLIN